MATTSVRSNGALSRAWQSRFSALGGLRRAQRHRRRRRRRRRGQRAAPPARRARCARPSPRARPAARTASTTTATASSTASTPTATASRAATASPAAAARAARPAPPATRAACPSCPPSRTSRSRTRGDTATHRLRAGRGRARLPHLPRAGRDRLAHRRRRRGRRQERHLPLRRRSRVPGSRGRHGQPLRLLDHRLRQRPPQLHAHEGGVRRSATSSSRRPPIACPSTALADPERRRRLPQRRLGRAALLRGQQRRVRHRPGDARHAARQGLARRRHRLLHVKDRPRRRPSTASSTRPAPTGRATTSSSSSPTGPSTTRAPRSPPTDIADMGTRFQILDAAGAGQRRAPPRARTRAASTCSPRATRASTRCCTRACGPSGSLTWPGVKKPTRFVIEALDAGCPFPNGYIAAQHHDADVDRTSMQPFNSPSLTARRGAPVVGRGVHQRTARSGEPPQAHRARLRRRDARRASPTMDFLATFDDGAAWAPFTKWQDNNAFIYRNADWAIDTSGCTENFTFGPLLGQFVLGFADGGSSCNVSITPRKVPTKIARRHVPARAHDVGHPVDGPALPADHGDQRAAPGRSARPTPATSTTCPCTRASATSRTRSRAPT